MPPRPGAVYRAAGPMRVDGSDSAAAVVNIPDRRRTLFDAAQPRAGMPASGQFAQAAAIAAVSQ